MHLDDTQTGLVAIPVALAIFWRKRIWLAYLAARGVDLKPLTLNPTATPLEFEMFCRDQLQACGWNAEVTVASGDQGVDVFAKRGRVSVVLQCKLYSKPVGNAAVQEVIAGRTFRGATHAAVVSNQTYTLSARELAVRSGVFLLAPADLARAHKLFR